MATLGTKIIELLGTRPGLTDREIAQALFGPNAPQQAVNQTCRKHAASGILSRRTRSIDGLIGNYVNDHVDPSVTTSRITSEPSNDSLSEDALKAALDIWLKAQGWETKIAWGRSRGIDIEARRGDDRWVIEAKGRGASPQAQGNYFLSALSELIQRMDDAQSRYSLAFPDLTRYRGLWDRLPKLAKSRLSVTMIFVKEDGSISER